MTDDAERETKRDVDGPGGVDVPRAPRRGSKLSSDAAVVLSTAAVLFTTVLAGFIGLFVMISNLFTEISNVHVTREQRLEVVREIVRDQVDELDARIRAVEIGQANPADSPEAGTDRRRDGSGN